MYEKNSRYLWMVVLYIIVVFPDRKIILERNAENKSSLLWGDSLKLVRIGDSFPIPIHYLLIILSKDLWILTVFILKTCLLTSQQKWEKPIIIGLALSNFYEHSKHSFQMCSSSFCFFFLGGYKYKMYKCGHWISCFCFDIFCGHMKIIVSSIINEHISSHSGSERWNEILQSYPHMYEETLEVYLPPPYWWLWGHNPKIQYMIAILGPQYVWIALVGPALDSHFAEALSKEPVKWFRAPHGKLSNVRGHKGTGSFSGIFFGGWEGYIHAVCWAIRQAVCHRELTFLFFF